MRIRHYRDRIAQLIKRALYGKRGEPYQFNGMELRFVLGSRPIRLKYVNSPNGINANDARQIELLQSSVREGATCLDVGAHHGQYTILMAALSGSSGKVIAFEPDPYARKILHQNIALNKRLKTPIVEEFACSDRIGNATFFSKHGNSQSSLARSAVEFDGKPAESLVVQTITIDHYIGLGHPLTVRDWVKIDAEGAEIRILNGGGQLLASDANIICELHPYAWQEFGNTYDELKRIVANASRRMVVISTGNEPPATPEYSTVLLEKR